MNTITLTGRLVADPELRDLPSATQICDLRLAVDGLGRNRTVGYIDVASFGAAGAAAARVLSKGRLVAVQGRLEHREWTTEDDHKRSAYAVIGHIEFLAAPKAHDDTTAAQPAPGVAADADAGDDDIPF